MRTRNGSHLPIVRLPGGVQVVGYDSRPDEPGLLVAAGGDVRRETLTPGTDLAPRSDQEAWLVRLGVVADDLHAAR